MSSIEQIYSEFKMEPLMPGDAKLYKGLYEKYINETQKRLSLIKKQNRKYLMFGHKGAGKSTFMNQLAVHDNIKDEFLVARYSINEIGNPYDFTHFDLLLSLALKGAQAAIENEITFSKDLLDEIKQMVKILTSELEISFDEETEKKVKKGGEIKIGLPEIPFISQWLSAKVYGDLQLNDINRQNLRKTYKVKPNELLKKINEFLAALKEAAGKDLLFLVDDMDKMPLEISFKLLDENRNFLEKPLANIIYMIDISVACCPRFAGISTIGETLFFPSVKIVPKPKSKQDKLKEEKESIKKNKKLLKELIFNWCPKEYIGEDAVEKIIEFGGGNIRQTIRLLFNSLDYVVIEKDQTTVTIPDVERAIIKRYNEYSLNEAQRQILQEIANNPEWLPQREEDITAPESPFLELLNNLAIIEYRNGDKKWRYPNPVLKSLLKK
ncbi:MAG: hypothetical protein R6V04_04935 [bacterium]